MKPEQREELKPCPFCGGQVTLEKGTRVGEMGARDWWGIKCRNTLNLGGTCAIEQIPSGSPEAAIGRWNRRAKVEALTVPQWQPIETAPRDGRTLLLGRFNSMGNWRAMRGQWFSEDAIAEEWEEPDAGEEGWYETAVEPDVPNCWAIIPTHWMELPSAPTIPATPGTKEGA